MPVEHYARFPSWHNGNIGERDAWLEMISRVVAISWKFSRNPSSPIFVGPNRSEVQARTFLNSRDDTGPNFPKGPRHCLFSGLSQDAVIQMDRASLLEARTATGRTIDVLQPLVKSNRIESNQIRGFPTLNQPCLSRPACELQRRKGTLDSAYVAVNFGEPLTSSHSDVSGSVSDASKSVNNLGRLFESQGDRGKTQDFFDQAISRLEQMTRADLRHHDNFACNANQEIGDAPESIAEEHDQARRNRNDRAIDALRRAVDAGPVRMENLEQDSDLDGLRNRPDFQESIESLDSREVVPFLATPRGRFDCKGPRPAGIVRIEGKRTTRSCQIDPLPES